MTATRFLLRTRYPAREGRKVLGIATGPKPPPFEAVHALADDHEEPADDAEPELTIRPRLQERQRKGSHEVGGPLGDGATLERRGYQRYELLDRSGGTLATIRIRTLPHRLRVETPAGQRVDLRNRRGTLNPVTALKRGLAGGLLSTWDGDAGLRVEHHGARSYALIDTARCPLELRIALVSAAIAVEHAIDPSDIVD